MSGNPARPFGPTPLAGGGTCFRLWAPGAQHPPVLELVAADGHTTASRRDMQAQADGWYERSVPEAGPGCLYRFRLADGLAVPDPASRFNPLGVHGPSEVIAVPATAPWAGRPWHEAVLYELHVGSFTPQGTLAAAAARLPELQALGITAVELMPLAAFAGRRGWGYDGVLPFAPHAAYGRPEALRAFVDRAHALGLMVLLDVVYNHFGPDGNYLGAYCPAMFAPDRHTAWGPAIRFEGAARCFFVQNALYWVEDFGFDGLRLDAVHAIHDTASPHIVAEIADALRQGPGRQRQVHLVLENDANAAHLLAHDGAGRPTIASAQWNDDWHHAAHVLATGDAQGYYRDYANADDAAAPLAHALAEGFVYQGQPSLFRAGVPRGEPSAHLPASAFVAFLQNHDQIGNRAFGERLDALAPPARVRALLACLLLSPQVPMLFMGEEFAATTPFLYFCDFEGELAAAVSKGRRAEFAGFAAFADPALREMIPDPNAEATFAASRLRWDERDSTTGRQRLDDVAALLALRRTQLLPLLPMREGTRIGGGPGWLAIDWRSGAAGWRLRANFSAQPVALRIAETESVVFALAADMLPAGRLQLLPDGVLVTHDAAPPSP